MSTADAIFEACMLRFRPILMTTMAALFGALPLAFGTGTGSELRRPLGITIVGGLIMSQMLTLYTTPVVYLYLDRLRLRVLGKHHDTFNPEAEKLRYDTRGWLSKRESFTEENLPHLSSIGSCARALLLLAGCMPDRNIHAPAPPPVAPAYKESTVNFQDAPAGRWPTRRTPCCAANGGRYSTMPELNASRRSTGNQQPEHQTFLRTIMAARALIREARAQYWPTVTTGPSWNRSKIFGKSAAILAPPTPGANASRLGSSLSTSPGRRISSGKFATKFARQSTEHR